MLSLQLIVAMTDLMKKAVFPLVSLIFLLHGCSNAGILFQTKEQTVYMNGAEVRQRLYIIHNTSQNSYYTWVNYDDTLKGDTTKIVSRYFFSLHNDFSLFALLTEDIVFTEVFEPTVGITFLKKIKPGETFTYITETDVDLSRNIVYLKETEVESIIGCSRFMNEDVILYKEDSIAIP